MEKENSLAFGRRNYLFMIIGLFIMVLGFIIMSLDKEQYGLGFMGITLGPIVVLIGFIMQFYAILTRPGTKK